MVCWERIAVRGKERKERGMDVRIVSDNERRGGEEVRKRGEDGMKERRIDGLRAGMRLC